MEHIKTEPDEKIIHDDGQAKQQVYLFEPKNEHPQQVDLPEDHLMVITKPTLDVFMKQEYPADLIALYMFYVYTAKWQRTNQPRCTDNYIKNGLRWGKDRVKRTQAVLKEIGLIQSVQRRDENGRIVGWYTKLTYMIKKDTVFKSADLGQSTRKPLVDFTTSGKQDTNALRDINRNALRDNKEYKAHEEEKKVDADASPKQPLREDDKKPFGHLQNVYLSQRDYDKLIGDYGHDHVTQMIDELANYDKLGKYTSHYLTIRNWLGRRGIRPRQKMPEVKTPSGGYLNGIIGKERDS